MFGCIPAAMYSFGLLCVSAYGDAGVPSKVDGNTLLPLGLVAAGLSIAVWVGRQYQSFSDRLDAVEKELRTRPCIKDDCAATKP
jgi:hypothetical protein